MSIAVAHGLPRRCARTSLQVVHRDTRTRIVRSSLGLSYELHAWWGDDWWVVAERLESLGEAHYLRSEVEAELSVVSGSS